MVLVNKVLLVCVIFYVSEISSERNRPTRYVRGYNRCFYYNATSFRFIGSPNRNQNFRFDVTVNNQISSTGTAIYNGEDQLIRRVTEIYGEDLEDYAFERPLIRFSIIVLNADTNQLYDSATVELGLTKGIPIEMKNINSRNNLFNVDFNFLVRCGEYVGFNCRFKREELPDNVRLNYFTGEILCRDNTKINPPACTENRPTPENYTCENGGIPTLIGDGSASYCNCLDGYRGERCELFRCNINCFPPNGTCVGPNTCQCLPGYEGTNCETTTCRNYRDCGSGRCFVSNNKHVCICNEGYFGQFCQYRCSPACVFGTCYIIQGKQYCKCLDGFTGDLCDISENPDSDQFDSKQTHSRVTAILISTVAVTSGICIICLLMQFNWGKKSKFNLGAQIGTMATQQFTRPMPSTIMNQNMPSTFMNQNNPHHGKREHVREKFSDDESYDEIEAIYDQVEDESPNY